MKLKDGNLTYCLGLLAVVLALITPLSAHAQCQRWLALPGQSMPGVDGIVYAIATLPDGAVIAAGSFSAAGTSLAKNIVRLDDDSWSPLGAGIGGSSEGSVYAIAVLPNGDIVAGGNFFAAGGVPMNRIARWNGQSWLPLGAGVDGSVSALAVLPNGDLVLSLIHI